MGWQIVTWQIDTFLLENNDDELNDIVNHLISSVRYVGMGHYGVGEW